MGRVGWLVERLGPQHSLVVDWLNYHHLRYFWATAKAGSVTAAAKQLGVTQPTVSNQLRELEAHCGGKLIERRGRKSELTALGQRVFAYADEIFRIGDELRAMVGRGGPEGEAQLRVGVLDSIPKLVAFELLAPSLATRPPVFLSVTEGPLDRLLGQLSVHELDLLITSSPIAPHFHVRAVSQVLGSSPVGIFGRPKLYAKLRKRFPASLDQAPLLVPNSRNLLRRGLMAWCEQKGITPHIVAEFDDSGLLKAFAHHGHGLFAAPTIIEQDLRETYGVERIGVCEELREQFFAVMVERHRRHPGAEAIMWNAGKLFAQDEKGST